jgi:cytochrome P450
VYMLNHPDYIKDALVTNSKNFIKGAGTEYLTHILGDGLLTSEGEFHLRQRRLAQPAFHRARIASYGDVMVRYAARLRDHWQDGASVDVAREMMSLTLAVVGKTLFDSNLASDRRAIAEGLIAFMEWWRIFLFPFPNLLHKLPLRVNRRYEQTKRRLDEIVYRLIAEHRAGGNDRGDLLSMLLIAQDTEGDGASMTDRQVRDEALTIIMAGHETTAVALSWAWYLLSQHPEVEAKLHEELDRVLNGRLPTVDDLPNLRYTEMVLAETMRLYPPAWGIGRKALNDYEVGGYIVPKDSLVVTIQYAVHRDPRYYPDPERFDPMRWTPEERAKRPKFAYFPFGGGNRLCIGEQFAWMEGVLLVATIAQKWQLRLDPNHKVETKPLITLRPKRGVWMKLVMRNT